MDERNQNHDVIQISETETEEEEDDDEEEIDQEEEEDSDEDDIKVQSSSDEGSEWNTQEDEVDLESFQDEDSDSSSNTSLDEQTRYNQVIDLLKGGCDLQVLKVDECKRYLRKHGLRITGTKEVCIQRIQEHWRIKNGNGEEHYPRSSFTINCTGDVCRGDIVLFKQRIYEKFNKVTRTGKLLGGRTVAGRVVNESYGAAKHQHTFTVEVLWSKGTKKLPPMFPLLVKGRNLYRLRTFRQPWHNEVERSNILAEKHIRGMDARHFRAMKKAYSSNGGVEWQKRSQQTSSRKSYRIQECGATGMVDKRKNEGHAKAHNWRPAKMKRVAKNRDPGSSSSHLQPIDLARHSYIANGAPNSYHGATQLTPFGFTSFHHSYREAQRFSFYETGSTVTSMTMPSLACGSNVMVKPELQLQGYGHAYTHADTSSSNQFSYSLSGTSTSCKFDLRRLNCWPDQSLTNEQLHAINSGVENHGRKANAPMICSMPGCLELGAKNCVAFSCIRCCRRRRRRCIRHQTKQNPHS